MFSVSMPRFVSPRFVSLSLAISGLFSFSISAAGAQQVQYSSAHSSAQRALPQTLSGGSKALLAKLAASRSGISLAVADVDGDGNSDLITGYSISGGGAFTLQRGSSSATAPSSSDWAAMQRGELVSPFAQNAEVTELPVQPDFLKAADIDGSGTVDVVVAAHGGNTAYVLFGDGHGGFSQPQALPVQGTITALTTLRTADGPSFVVAGVCGGAAGCSLQVMSKDGTVHASLALPASASAVEAVAVNGHMTPDLAVVAGGKLLLADGLSIEAGTATFETLPVSNAVAISAGSFVYDRRPYPQLAVLDSSATLHVLARPGVNNHALTQAEIVAFRHNRSQKVALPANPSGLGWAEVETVNSVGSGGTAPIMLRGRLSGSGGDDLLVLTGSQYVTVHHAIDTSSATVKTTPSVILDSTSSSAVAAVATRVSPDARLGVVIADGTAKPNVAPTLPTVNKTYTVNTTADTFDSLATAGRCTTAGPVCSLRDAIDLANKDSAANISAAKTDTVSVPAGTYALTDSTSYNYASALVDPGDPDLTFHIEITGPVNIVGAGAGATIIDGKQNDKIFSINNGLLVNAALFDTFISGVTLQNGKNVNNATQLPIGAYNNFGGILDWDSFGGGYLTITNSTLQNSTILWGPGGGIVGFNSSGGGSGTIELDSCTMSGNSTPEAGGAIETEYAYPAVILNATTISNNKALQSVNPSDGAGVNITEGGGLFLLPGSSVQSAIINGSVISGNQSGDDGGGVWGGLGLLITSSSFTGNTSGTYGGGLFLSTDGETATITSGTFTTNSATTDGGGIFLNPGSPNDTLNMHYSRIHGNINSTHSGLGMGVTGGSAGLTANATDNWWGCNGAATGTGCDVAGVTAVGTLTVSPYTTLTLSLSSATPTAGTTITATGSLGQDSNSTTYTTAQDVAYLNVPATLTIVQGSSTTNSSATALNSNAAIVTTATASASGTAKVTVDGTSVSKTFTVTAPILAVTSTHTGNFVAGSTGNTYTLSVANSGNSSTVGTVTVVDTLPSGFTATAISGTGWSCTLGTLTCTNSTALATSSSLPAITLTVSVSGTDVGVYTNSVAVSGGGAAANSGTDSTTVLGPPTLLETFNPVTTVVNQNVVLSFQLTNPNSTVALSAVSFVDVLPTGIVIATPTGAVNSCGGTPSITAGGNSVVLTGASIAAGSNCTLSLDVFSSAAGVYVNNTGAPNSSAGSGTGGSATLTVDGSLWVINANGTVAHLSEAGTLVTTAGTAGTIGTLGAVAYDNTGDVWAVANGTSVVKEFTSGGTADTVSGNAAAGVNTPASLAIDGLGQVWVANGNNSVSVLSATGTAVTPSTGYQGGSISTPTGIVIDNSGSVWIPNSGNNSVTKIIGGAAPVVTPTVTGTTNNTLGTRP